MILYGTEAGMWGANDPCCRQPMLWDDIAYRPETRGMHGPLGKSTPRAPDRAFREATRALLRLRGAHPALRRGSFAWLEDLPEPVVGFVREGGGEKLLAFAVEERGADHLWALEQNHRAIAFYERHGFVLTQERKPEDDTDKFLVLLKRG